MRFHFGILLIFALCYVAFGQIQISVDLANPRCQTCCCGNLMGGEDDQIPDAKTKCCGMHRYDPKRDICCQGKLTRGLPEFRSSCCGDTPYDERYYTCCKNTFVVPATSNQDQCCFKTAYNQKHQICCGRGQMARVYNRSDETACCGNRAFTSRFSMCCNERVLMFSGWSHLCCGDVHYSPREQVCINPETNELADAPQVYIGQNIYLPCGSSTWNPVSHTCCKGQLYNQPVDMFTGCCGKIRYILQIALCCQGKLHFRNPKFYECCGEGVYDVWFQTCCGGKVFNKKGICCGTTAVFNPQKEICCHEETVFPGCPTRTKCCFAADGSVAPYDTIDKLCCEGVVQPGGWAWDCCGQQSYNTIQYSCCDGVLVDRNIFRTTEICTL